MQLYVDMDGVLADFDTHHYTVFGIRASKLADNVDWKKVRAVDGFYRNMPPMADLSTLWARIEGYRPIVLTGVPHSVEEASENKRDWVRRHLGDHVQVICCRSSDKSMHMQPGDVLIDDWEKYRNLWIAKGGIWITHRSATETVAVLDRLEQIGFI